MDLNNISENDIENIFKDRESSALDVVRKNSIMATLIEIDGKLNFVFTKRALTLDHQPGDICFPGGKQEDGENSLEAALRETEEELCINRRHIKVIGKLDYTVTMFNALITPYICILKDISPSDLKPNPDEVDRLLFVPVDFFADYEPIITKVYLNQSYPSDFPIDLIYNGKNYKWGKAYLPQYFYRYDGETIWGITARITNNVLNIINGFKG